jgi:hypothetical protein
VILYDGLAQPLPIYVYAIGIAALALLAACLIWRLTGRQLKWYIPLVIAAIGLFAGGVPIWDQLRVRKLATTEGGLKVSRGVISQVWHIETRSRDMTNKTSITYKTWVSEGFDIGTERFAWRPGSCLSTASMCGLAQSRQKLVEGMAVEVRWFEDSAMENERRVVQLRKMEDAAPQDLGALPAK